MTEKPKTQLEALHRIANLGTCAHSKTPAYKLFQEALDIAVSGVDLPATALTREDLVRALAKAHGLNWDERCGYEISNEDPDAPEQCDSSTCVAAHYEDHDPDQARSDYGAQADAIIALLSAKP